MAVTKRLAYFCCLALLFLLAVTVPALALEIEASSAILIDAQSGRILYEKNAHQSLPTASTTKILTALLALEHYPNLQTEITLPADFANVGEATIWLEPGETHTVKDLLYATLLRSANDAAQALAIGISGSEATFAELMNQRTQTLGLSESNWVNPHGLHDDNHYSSAYDLAMITRAAFKIPAFNELIKTASHTIKWEGHDDRVVQNHNQLLKLYEGADGVKTGYTSKSGSCLVGSATRNGLRLIGVVLNSNSEQVFPEMTKLLDYGFENYKMEKVASSWEVAYKIPLVNGRNDSINVLYGQDVYVLLKNDETYTNKPTYNLPERLLTPVDRDVSVGTASFADAEGYAVTVDLYPAENVERYTFWGVVKAAFQRFWQVLLV